MYTCTYLKNITDIKGANVGLTCDQWAQEGGIQQPTCFPAQATVMTRTGPKTMSELAKGEDILGFDHATGRAVFSSVRAWLHRDPMAEVRMAAVKSDSGTVIASSRHSLAVQAGNSYKFAADLEPGKDNLVGPNGSAVAVRQVSKTITYGLYAPLTGTSNFFVGGPGETPGVLAHSFAQLKQPRRYEGVFQRFLTVAEFFWPSISNVDHSSRHAYIHPVAKLWMWVAGIPTTQELQQAVTKRTIRPNGEHGFDDIESPDDSLVEEGRRLMEPGGSSRRLQYGQGGQEQDNELMVILFGVVQVMPPWLRHGVVPAGTPGYAPGLTPLQPSEDIAKWVENGVWWSTINTVILSIVSVILLCCSFICQTANGMSSSREYPEE